MVQYFFGYHQFCTTFRKSGQNRSQLLNVSTNLFDFLVITSYLQNWNSNWDSGAYHKVDLFSLPRLFSPNQLAGRKELSYLCIYCIEYSLLRRFNIYWDVKWDKALPRLQGVRIVRNALVDDSSQYCVTHDINEWIVSLWKRIENYQV